MSTIDPLNARPGSVKIGTVGGIPIFLHWKLLIGILPVAIATRFDPLLTCYYFIALAALVVVHELGHVVAALTLNLKVYGFHLTFLGGHCVIQTTQRVRDAAMVYAGGVGAQALLLVLTYLCVLDGGEPTTALGEAVVTTFTITNFIVILFNLIPLKYGNGMNSDGLVLLQLLRHVLQGRPYPFPAVPDLRTSTLLAPDTRLADLPAMVPLGFTTGIEIMNDDKTPMEFVVEVLGRFLFLNRQEATAMMLQVHRAGGVLLAVDGFETSQAIAAAITRQAREAGHPLVCRAVDMRVAQAPSL